MGVEAGAWVDTAIVVDSSAESFQHPIFGRAQGSGRGEEGCR